MKTANEKFKDKCKKKELARTEVQVSEPHTNVSAEGERSAGVRWGQARINAGVGGPFP